VVEDHPLVRHALHELLAERFMIVGEASGGQEAVQKALELRPDVVIMDVGLPDLNGIVAAQRIKAALATTQVVILTAKDDDSTILGAIEAGAISVVVKGEETQTILQAIEQASCGLTYLPPAIARRLMNAAVNRLEDQSRSTQVKPPTGLEERQRANSSQLTPRELEILRLVATGGHNRDVALDLGISERTVMNHLMSIYGKLGIRGRTGATAYAIKHKLITV